MKSEEAFGPAKKADQSCGLGVSTMLSPALPINTPLTLSEIIAAASPAAKDY
jgi:hypothetical protein